MCGRFTQKSERSIITREFYIQEFVSEVYISYNVAPSEEAGVVLREAQDPAAGNLYTRFRWGLVPFWADDPGIGNRMINARAESVAEKASFRNAFRHRRCLVPADGFFEWQKRDGPKQPFYVRLASGRPMSLAGLWEAWDGSGKPPQPSVRQRPPGGEGLLYTFTIITTGANVKLGKLHDRMPVIIPPECRGDWLRADHEDTRGLLELLAPAPEEWVEFFPVSREVNSPRNKSPRCIEPAG
ncbi:MAG: SOS response-associated peptidase [Spirochaetota bacterium]